MPQSHLDCGQLNEIIIQLYDGSSKLLTHSDIAGNVVVVLQTPSAVVNWFVK